jgi:hypothetical protein
LLLERSTAFTDALAASFVPYTLMLPFRIKHIQINSQKSGSARTQANPGTQIFLPP